MPATLRSAVTSRSLLALLCFACLVILIGCTPIGTPLDSGFLGVTSGGEQDIAASRAQIRSGYVPDPDSITVAGFLSEHDIPLTPPENAPEIYASVGHAWRHPFGEPAPMVDVFVRLGSTIDVSQFQRRPQNLAVVVDRSGSMNWSASDEDYRSKLEAVKQALHTLVDQLTAEDRLTLLSFNTRVTTDVPSTPGDSRDLLHNRIDKLEAKGDTNLYDAMRAGFEALAATADPARDSRLILFTDVQPTAGPSSSGEFLDMQRVYADAGIGFTLMGVGQDYGDALAADIARVRGGNAFYLSNEQRITQIFTEEFDYFVSPAASDLVLEIAIPDGVGVRDVYGVPDYAPGSRGALIHIPTLFFSAREGGGAIVVRLTLAQSPTFETDVSVAQLRMSYTLTDGTPRELGGELVLSAGLSPTADPPFYSDDAVRRAALLLDTALMLRAAAQAGYDGRYADGAAEIRAFLAEFDKRSLGMSDRTDATSRGLSDERALLETLLGTLERRARAAGDVSSP